MELDLNIIKEIKLHRRYLLKARSVFPHMHGSMQGAKQFPTPEFYQNYGFNVNFSFDEPLTINKIREFNGIGYWINQNYVVRLYALLNSYKIVFTNKEKESEEGSIDTSLEGHNEIDILRRLRNEFAHSSGWYNSKDQGKRKLRNRIIKHFSLQESDYPEPHHKFPIPIDKVLMPLTEGCINYVNAYIKKRDTHGNQP